MEDRRGPARALSYSTPIDDNTTLSIWGHKTGYSYQLELVKQTPTEPFVSRREPRQRSPRMASTSAVCFAQYRAVSATLSGSACSMRSRRSYAIPESSGRIRTLSRSGPSSGIEDDLTLAQWTPILIAWRC